MSILDRTRHHRQGAVAVAAALCLGAVTLLSAPAKAQLYFGVGPFGVAVGAPMPYYYDPYYYGPYYYPPPYYYWHHDHHEW